MDTNDQLLSISKDLNIKFHKNDAQDWGIINSDLNRVNEFIDYFNNNDLNSYAQFHVFELIVASYNDAILDGKDNLQLKARFLNILKEADKTKNLDIIIDYWKRIYNEEEFPVGKIM